MKAVSLSLISSIFLFVGTIVSGSNGAFLRSNNNQDNDHQRILQSSSSSDEVIRTDLVRLIPFDVQLAIQDDASSSTSSAVLIESLYPILTDTITDWMMESFEIKTINPNTQLVNNNTSFDSIALELIDQTSSKGTINGQVLNLVQVSFEGVSLWERVGTGTPPMEPEIVELIQRATFLEDKKLKDELQITINTLLIDLGMYENNGSEEQQSPISIVDVRAYITPTGGGGDDNGNNNGNSNNGGAQSPSPNTGNQSLEIIIIAAIVVACLAFALLMFAVIWAWRSDRRDNQYYDEKPSQGQGGTERAAVVAVGGGGGSKSSKQQQQRKSNKSSNKSATSSSSSNKNKKLFGGGKQNRNSSVTQKQRGDGGRNSKNNKYDNNNNNNDDDPGVGGGVTDFPDILNNGSYPKEIGNVDGNDTDDYDDSVVNGGTDNQYPGDSVYSEDISSSLTAYYKSGMGYNNNQGGGNQPRHHLINDQGGGGDDGASLSSMDSYGYSLDGYAPSLGPAQGGYPVGPLQAARDAPIPIGDSMDEIGHMDIVQLQQEEESVADYDAEPTPATTAADNDEA